MDQLVEVADAGAAMGVLDVMVDMVLDVVAVDVDVVVVDVRMPPRHSISPCPPSCAPLCQLARTHRNLSAHHPPPSSPRQAVLPFVSLSSGGGAAERTRAACRDRDTQIYACMAGHVTTFPFVRVMAARNLLCNIGLVDRLVAW